MISIIMPTYNRFDVVEESIRKALCVDSETAFELIVVNDGEELPFSIQHPNLTIVRNPGKGVSCARNYGASKAKYPVLFFVDDDMWVTKESLTAIERLYAQNFFETSCTVLNWEYPASLVEDMRKEKVGRYLLRANFQSLEGRLKQAVDKNNLLMPLTSIGSGSFVIGKMLFETVGRYDETIIFQGEDIEMSKNLNAHKIPIFLYTPVVCYHNQKDRLDIQGFLDRESRGYLSQFRNKKTSTQTDRLKQFIYSALIPFHSLILLLFRVIPNRPSFDFFTFRIIGILSSIIYFKAWRLVHKENSFSG